MQPPLGSKSPPPHDRALPYGARNLLCNMCDILTVHYLPKEERDALLKEMRAVLLDAADRTATQ